MSSLIRRTLTARRLGAGEGRTMRLVVLAVAITSLALAFPAAPSTATVPAAAKLGAVIPLTGRYASGGAQVRAGYEFAVSDVNARGGVRLGTQHVQLQLTVVDDESDPTKTVSRLE